MTPQERNTLLRYFRDSKARFKDDRSEWARALRRAYNDAQVAVEAVAKGQEFDWETQEWRDRIDAA